jgi:hypothetical protein
MPRCIALVLTALLVACAVPPTQGAPSSTTSASPVNPPTDASRPSPPATYRSEPTLRPRVLPLVPPLQPDPRFKDLSITLAGSEPPGQPWEAIALTVTWPTVDAAYVSRVSSALGVAGPGTHGAAPDGTAPWRIWLGNTILAVNERTGDVLFFDPKRDDGPPPSGPAVHDPALEQERLVGTLGGTTASFRTDLPHLFHGDATTALTAGLFAGSWAPARPWLTTVLFPTYENQRDQLATTIFDVDELQLASGGGHPLELLHRPLAGIALADIYDINSVVPLPDAIREVKRTPAQYLRLLSVPPTEPVALRIDDRAFMSGHAWAGGSAVDLTRIGATLVPVYAFHATGTTRSGTQVEAVFTIDAIAAQYRAPLTSTARNVTADDLLRRQLSVSVGGHKPSLLSAEGALQDELAGFACAAGQYTLSNTDADTAVASVTCPSGAKLGLTMKRAFPGLGGSIWYLSEARK